MKYLFKTLIFMCCCSAVLSLASCLSDSEDTTIDLAKQQGYQTQMSGTYSGKLRFFMPSQTTANRLVKYDSLTIAQCSLGRDSVMRISAYDENGRHIINCLDSAIISSATDTKYSALFEAVKNAESEADEITGRYYVPNTNYVQTNRILFVSSLLLCKKLNYDGKDHYVYFSFGTPYGYYGSWSTSYNASLIMMLDRIYVTDTKKTAWELSSSSAIESAYTRQNLFITFEK